MSIDQKKLEEICINTIRFLAVDGVQKANSGHPGMPMGCAPIAYLLFTKHMKYNPANPSWYNRDRFVLSAGHGSMLLYSMLHLTGYSVSMNELKSFRQWNSITPGHPEYHLTPGVETTTGPLGQGFTNAIGMAIARNYLSAMFNKEDIKIIDHYIYVIASDGDMMEGISHEAASLAAHLKLGGLIVLYDNNGISIDGETKLAFSEDVSKRFLAYGWNVLEVKDVNNLAELNDAIEKAKGEKSRPTFISVKTHIGYGSPNKQDKASSHGSPLGAEEVKLTKKNLGWPEDKEFYIPAEAGEFYSKFKKRGEELENEWKSIFKTYSEKYPDEAKLYNNVMSGNFGDEWKSKIPAFKDEGKKIATRAASGTVLNAIAPVLPTLIGGSADLAPSNNTYLKEYPAFSADNYGGRNFHFGVREHAMAGILNGMATYGGVIPYGGTFFIFSDYLRPAIRLGCISGIRPIYVLTHDSIGVGEDGPTHEPVEHLAAIRAIPKLSVIRPAEANETAQAWKAALEHKGSPVALILARQSVPVLDQTKYPSAENLVKGAYVLVDSKSVPEIILMASGSEVSVTLKAAEKLSAEGIKVRVVSFPSWDLFEKQSQEYKNSVFPPEIKARVAVEAGVKLGWDRYVGSSGDVIGIEKYGASAPLEIIMEKYGFSADNIVSVAKKVLKKVNN
jgi:transketolase